MRYENLPIEKVELDIENPRIKNYLSIYKKIDSKDLALALSGSPESDGSEKYRALRDSIKENGGIFTPIIVNHTTEDDRYVAIEGNTRLKFYMEFNEENPDGTWSSIPSIVYDDMDENEKHAIRLQAHMVGARDWDAFSKAKYLDYLYNEEQKPMSFLKDFCGGQESYIRLLIEAYKDMENVYRPYCEENGIDFNTADFSYFVELQKKGTKDALLIHNYDVRDFSEWVIDGKKIPRAESVRKLTQVMNDDIARKTFIKSGMDEAVKKLDVSDKESRKLAKTNLYALIKETIMKLRKMDKDEILALMNDPKYDEQRELIYDLRYEADSVCSFIEEE